MFLFVVDPTSKADRAQIMFGKDRKSLINLIIQQLRTYNFDGIVFQSGFAFSGIDTDTPAIVNGFMKVSNFHFQRDL